MQHKDVECSSYSTRSEEEEIECRYQLAKQQGNVVEERHFKEMKQLYQLATTVHRNTAEYEYKLGEKYGFTGTTLDYPKALYWLQKAADHGIVGAQTYLGKMYRDGLGVPQDYQKALMYNRKAAYLGDDFAQAELADMYITGSGVPQDDRKAAAWFKEAARQGNIFAQSYLGKLYLCGRGVPQDDRKAAEWLQKAAEKGEVAAQNNLEFLRKKRIRMPLLCQKKFDTSISRLFSAKSSGAFELDHYLPPTQAGINGVRVMRKIRKPSSKYFVKSPDLPEMEVVAKELSRLICPAWQPKTRLVTNAAGDLFVASKEVPKFKSLATFKPYELYTLLSQQKLVGLGFACVIQLVINDVDFHLNNVGKDRKNHVVVIDDDNAFYRCQSYLHFDFSGENKKYTITQESIAALPSLTSYEPYNWLYSVQHILRYPDDQHCLDKLNSHPGFKHEINVACLYFLLLSTPLIEEFVDAYCLNKSIATILKTELINRIEQLKQAVLHRSSFKKYLLSDDAAKEAEKFGNQVKQFKVIKKQGLAHASAYPDYAINQLKKLQHDIKENKEKENASSPPVKLESIEQIVDRLSNSGIEDYVAFNTNPFNYHSERDTALLLVITDYLKLNSKTVSHDQINKIINTAYKSNFSKFDKLYNFICEEIVKDKDAALGPYKTLKDYFTTFSDPHSSPETMIQVAKQIEDFLQKHYHLFSYHDQTPYTKLTTQKGQAIDWLKYIKITPYMISFIHPTLRVRLGDARDTCRLDKLSLDDIKKSRQTYAPVFSFFYYKNGEAHGYIPESFLFDEVKRRDALIHDSIDKPDRLTIEEYIANHAVFLAFTELSPNVSKTFYNAIKDFHRTDAAAAKQFLNDFFCHPEYPYGLYHLRHVRKDFCPKWNINDIIYSSCKEVCKYPYHEFSSFGEESDYEKNIFTRLFFDFMPEQLSFHQSINLMVQHFFINMTPISILERYPLSSYYVDYNKESWDQLANNLFYEDQLPFYFRYHFVLSIIGSNKTSTAPSEFINFLPLSQLDDMEDKQTILTFLKLINVVLKKTNSISNLFFEKLSRFLKSTSYDDGELNQVVNELKKLIESKKINDAICTPVTQHGSATLVRPCTNQHNEKANSTQPLNQLAPRFFTKKITDFEFDGDIPVWQKGGSNIRVLCKEKKPSSRWFVKAPWEGFPEWEVFANELTRLIYPRQPKCRLIKKSDDEIFVASKEVPGYINFFEANKTILDRQLKRSIINGLGFVCIISLLVNEYDLNEGNVGVDSDSYVVKIDGDLSLYYCLYDKGKEFSKNDFAITAKTLMGLPKMGDYRAVNWLHESESFCQNDGYLDELNHNLQFKKEIHEAILYCLLLPYDVIDKLASTYFSIKSSMLTASNEIKERILQLKEASFQLEDFKKYLQSSEADEKSNDFIRHLSNFTIGHKEKLIDNLDLDKHIKSQLASLRQSLVDKDPEDKKTDPATCVQAKFSFRSG